MTEQHATEPTFADVDSPDDTFEPEPTYADAAPVEQSVEDQIRAAEAAQQRSVCRIPDGDLPDDLAKALERRVEVNLAQYDGGEIRRVGGTDPEVRRLEAPWSKTAPQE